MQVLVALIAWFRCGVGALTEGPEGGFAERDPHFFDRRAPRLGSARSEISDRATDTRYSGLKQKGPGSGWRPGGCRAGRW